MELDQEKLTRNESERSRELAQRIRRELGPCSVQVLGGVGALESALEATGAVQPAEGALPELLVVVDPEWVTLPQQLADRVLLVSVTRKCNQTNQKQAIINCKHHKPKMQRYASERNTVPAV